VTYFKVTVPESARYSGPYWFRPDPGVDRFSTVDGFSGIEAYAPPPLIARLSYRSSGVPATVESPVQYRWFDAPTGQEKRSEVKVVPKVSVSITPDLCIVSRTSPAPCVLKVTARNQMTEAVSARLEVNLPAGWASQPRSVSVAFSGENEAKTQRFTIRPPSGLRAGSYEAVAVASVGDESFTSGFEEISYSHIQNRHFYSPSTLTLRVFDVSIPNGLRVGYVMGVGDGVGAATEQLGASVDYLTEEDLSSGNLSRYDVIITGIRAYLNRDDLIANNSRLLEYVQAGGHLVVQYNKYEFLRRQYTPFPVTIDRPHDRVTVEQSPVRILQPRHAIFTRPNRITRQDWDGWVQERGLYFLGEWDEHFTPMLELQDPWPYNDEPKQGALLLAKFGRGTYVYTGLAFFRQLPAGVTGAYRLWANLISLGKVSKGQ
jgi:hypothetical protein